MPRRHLFQVDETASSREPPSPQSEQRRRVILRVVLLSGLLFAAYMGVTLFNLYGPVWWVPLRDVKQAKPVLLKAGEQRGKSTVNRALILAGTTDVQMGRYHDDGSPVAGVPNWTVQEYQISAYHNPPFEGPDLVYDHVIRSPTTRVTLDGRPLTLESYGIIYAGTPGHVATGCFDKRWDSQSRPMDDLDLARWHGMNRRGVETTYFFMFDVDPEMNPQVDEVTFATRDGKDLATFCYQQDYEDLEGRAKMAVGCMNVLPLPDASQLNLDIFHGNTLEAALPLEASTVVDMTVCQFRLQEVLSGNYRLVMTGGNAEEAEVQIKIDEQKGPEQTILIGEISDPAYTKAYQVRAELRDGQIHEADCFGGMAGLVAFTIPAASEEIVAATLLRSPRLTRVSFLFDETKGLPAVNAGERDALDLVYPSLYLKHEQDLRQFLTRNLGPYLPYEAQPQVKPDNDYLENVTVQQVLDWYYPAGSPLKRPRPMNGG